MLTSEFRTMYIYKWFIRCITHCWHQLLVLGYEGIAPTKLWWVRIVSSPDPVPPPLSNFDSLIHFTWNNNAILTDYVP